MLRHSLRAAALALALGLARPATAALSSGTASFSRGSFNLAEAYPGAVGSYDPAQGITTPQVFAGACPSPAPAPGATPGILSLQRRGLALDVNCFAVIPEGQVGPCFVQSYRLTKTTPGSIKCPDVYGSGKQSYVQFGSGVRTWWSLNFTQPGTTLTLEVVSVCRAPAATDIGPPRLHKDIWSWEVIADVNTMGPLIELMHTGAVSTLEVPCILGEDMYEALKKARQRLADALSSTVDNRLTEIGNAIFDFEALIVTNCLFTEVLKPTEAFKGPDQFDAPNFQPPGNLAPTVSIAPGSTAVAGLIDTTEHPCCCKLLVDLEWIAIQNGLAQANSGTMGTEKA